MAKPPNYVSIFESITSQDQASPRPIYLAISESDSLDVQESNFPGNTLPRNIRYYPNKLSIYDRLFSVDVLVKSHTSIVKILDDLGQPLKEEVVALDKVPLIGTEPFNATPEGITHPWFFVQLSFDSGHQFLLTYGKDVVVKKVSGASLLFEGRILSELTIRKFLGDELYGSIVFPEVSFTVDNSDNAFSFLATNPEIAYGGRVHIWRWDPINNQMVDAYAGIIVAVSLSNLTIDFTMTSIARSFLDKIVPISEASEAALSLGQTVEQKTLGKFFGRNLNVFCPLVYESGPNQTPEYRYFAGWGNNIVTAVRRNGTPVPDISTDPTYGWQVSYDSKADATYIVFKERQTDFSGNYYNITADIEGMRSPLANMLRGTEDFENTSVWTHYGMLTVKDKVSYGPDGRKSASLFVGGPGQSYIQQDLSVSNLRCQYGLFGYVLVKTLKGEDLAQVRTLNVVTAAIEMPAELNMKVRVFIDGNDVSVTDSANFYEGTEALGNDWYLLWFKYNRDITVSSSIGFRILDLVTSNALIYGAYLAQGKSLTISNGEPTDDLARQAYERVTVDGRASTRNFAMNVRDVLLDPRYGFGEYLVDDESVEKVAMELFKRHIYCDGAIDTRLQGVEVLNDLTMPLNCRLERRGVFRKWYLFSDIPPSNASRHSFGYGSNQDLNNILSEPQILVAPSTEFLKGVIFSCVPIRDNTGQVAAYRRERKKIRNDIEFGKIVQLSNRFVRYESTADILAEYFRNKKKSDTWRVQFSTDDPAAWSLELDDIITLYVSHLGLNGELCEIVDISKGIRAVDITVRKYDSQAYTYTGNYPRDRDFDKNFFESLPGGSQGSSGEVLTDQGEPGGVPSLPLSSQAKLFLRKASGSSGQELVILFADGSSKVIARSVSGSPGDLDYVEVTEEITLQTQPIGGFVIGSGGSLTYSQGYLSKVAIISNNLKPRVFVDGVEQDVVLKTGVNPADDYPTEYGLVYLRTFDQQIRAPSDYGGRVCKVTYQVPTDFTAFLGCSVEGQTPERFVIHKSTGGFLRGVKFLDRPSIIRAVLVGGTPYFYVLDRYYDDSTSLPDWGIRVNRFNRFGYPDAMYKVDFSSVDLSNPLPGAPSASDPCNPAMDVDSAGQPYFVFSDSNNKTVIFAPKTDGSYVWKDISDICENKEVLCMAYDSKRNQFHICIADNGHTKVRVLDSSFGYTGIEYHHYSGYAVTYHYNANADEFYATLYGQPNLVGGAVGYQIFGPTGQEKTTAMKFSNSSMVPKDIFRHSDDYCYLTYAQNGDIKMGMIHIDILKNNGPDSIKVLATGLGAPTDDITTRAFGVVLEAVPITFDQVV